MTISVSLCLLTWNEVDGCRLLVPHIPTSLFHEILAIDGGSGDGTAEYLSGEGIMTIRQSQPSYNAAYIEAFQNFSGDAIIFFHPKGTIEVSSLAEMVTCLQQGADLVIASRMLTGARNEEDGRIFPYRKLFGVLLAFVAALRWGGTSRPLVTDPLHGYRGMSRDFIESLSLHSQGVTADLEIVRQAYKGGVEVKEIPVVEIAREHGSTHFPAFKTGRKLLRLLLWD